MSGDVFDTAGIRRRVVEAWAASPARFREDANLEEDFALGGYRDRLVVELAQNAADAAVKAGQPGRLRLTVGAGMLSAANTGTPLDAAGVEGLSTLRASAKRGEPTVGRLGVGFSAVLAVTDSPAVVSRDGGVRWSLAEGRRLVASVPALQDELARREGAVPALRLPWPAEGGPPGGYDTEVRLPFRDGAAEASARRLLAEVDDALLLALPGLAELIVDIDGRVRTLRARREGDCVTIDDDGAARRWHLAATGGEVSPELLADRPTEERLRPGWSVTWAVPVTEGGAPLPLPAATPPVVHAPTPTDEKLGLPVLLLASFPLDTSRRHVAPGPLRDFLVARSGETYTALLRELPATAALLGLIPGPVGAGELDAEIRRAVVRALPATAFLPAATGEGPLRPRDAVLLEGAGPPLVGILAPALPGLLPAGWDDDPTALSTAGVRRLGLAELVDLLATLDREPGWWRALYDAMPGALGGSQREALAGLPVPLADGRIVRSPRGVLLPAPDLPHLAPAALQVLGLRVVHPDADHALLDRLGAVRGTPLAVLADPGVRAAVRESYDADQPEVIAGAVLGLVTAARLPPGEQPWLADLALADADGEIAVAGELMLPDSPIVGVVRGGALGLVAPELVDRWGDEALEAVGVLRTLALVRDEDVALDPDACDHDLDDEEVWLEEVRAAAGGADLPPTLPDFRAVRDLDLVAADAWPLALRMLATPPLRDAVTEPARALLPGGGAVDVVPYTAWWLRRHPVLRGRRPGELRAPGADALLEPLYDETRTDLDLEMLRAVGVRSGLEALLAEPGGPDELLDRLADPRRSVDPERLRTLYRALAGVAPQRVTPPARLRAVVRGEPVVVDADEVVVADAPDLLPLLVGRPLLCAAPGVAAALADRLDVPLASEVAPGVVTSRGVDEPVPGGVRWLLPGVPGRYVEHDPLLVDGVEIDWRYVGGVVHASTPYGLARGLAWAAGWWDRRFEVAALLEDPARAAELRAERDFEG
ncbi:MAG: sacsin N-terminal ATP-binding-like domain-containing protein [Streptomycetales bacterium]